MQQLKTSHKGNAKLGPKISTLSREVGPTCPDSCIHLGTNCYAERLQKIYPNVLKAARNNNKIHDWQKIRSFLIEAKKKDNAVRLHVLGDVLKQDSIGRKILDRPYINAIKKAVKSIKDPPKIWMYTHVLRKEVASLADVGIKVYASIDDAKSEKIAKAAGFKLFAYKTDLRKGKDTDKWFLHNQRKLPICPEQVRGIKCDECKICINGVSSLGFMDH